MLFAELIDRIQSDRSLPAYSVERRVSFFVEFFLPDILTHCLKKRVDLVAPEFPLKHEDSNRSNKVDYLCVFRETRQPIFVELKAENSFHKEKEQKQADNYLKHAQSWTCCVGKLRSVTQKSKSDDRVKYYQMWRRLEKHGLVCLCEKRKQAVEDFLKTSSAHTGIDKPRRSKLINCLADSVEACTSQPARVCYLGPKTLNETISEYNKKQSDSKVKLEFIPFTELPKVHVQKYPQEYKLLAELLARLV